jgi:hypothetical protein
MWDPPSCEGLLYSCCIGVVNLTFFGLYTLGPTLMWGSVVQLWWCCKSIIFLKKWAKKKVKRRIVRNFFFLQNIRILLLLLFLIVFIILQIRLLVLTLGDINSILSKVEKNAQRIFMKRNIQVVAAINTRPSCGTDSKFWFNRGQEIFFNELKTKKLNKNWLKILKIYNLRIR